MATSDAGIVTSVGAMGKPSASNPVASRARTVLTLFSGNLAATGVTVVGSVLTARWTDPYHMGLWNFALLVATYLSVLQLGVFNGLNRQLPFYQGRQESGQAQRVMGTAVAWCIGLTLATVVTAALVCVGFAITGRRDAAMTTVAIGVVVAASWSSQLLTVDHAAHGDFRRLARGNLIGALIGLPLVLLVRAIGYGGLLVRAAVLAVVQSAILYRQRPLRTAPLWDTSAFKELVRIGLPIWGIGQLSALFMTLDRAVLAHEPHALGIYSIAAQFAAMALMVPAAFSAVMYPDMVRTYAASGNAMRLWQMALRNGAGACAAGALAGAIAWVAIPPFVRLVLPAYAAGIEAAQWAALTGLAMAFSVFGNVFNVLGRQLLYLVAAAVGLACFAGAWFVLTRLAIQPSVVAAAQAMLAGNLGSSIAAAVISLALCRRRDAVRARIDGVLKESAP